MDTTPHIRRRGFLSAAAGTAATVGYTRTGRGAIDPDLKDRSGRVEGVVRLDDEAIGEEITGGNDRLTRERTVSRLRTHAASTQQRVVDYVKATPGIEIRRQFWLANAVLVSVDTELGSLDDLATVDGVKRIHRTGSGTEQRRERLETTESPVAQKADEVSYGLEMMNVPEVWERFDTRGEGATVAVIDSGVDPSHPDIDLKGWAEFDAEGNRVDNEPYDPDGHGTGMSSLATGGDASGTQIGVAPEADLLVARYDSEDFFTSALAALEWVVNQGADVVSMSFEFGPLKHAAIEPIANARAAGTVVVGTAVTGPEMYFSPGAMYSVLSTGAIDSERTPYKGGNGGEIRTDRFWRSDLVPEDWPDRYAAPKVATAGVDVLAALPDNDELDGGHKRTNGYSNGPPHVSGVVALLRSLDRSLSPEEIEQLLIETADQPGEAYEQSDPNGTYGHGIVNAAAAVAELQGPNREVSGTVADTDGAPVSGATVTAVTGDSTETDSSGRYTLSVPSDEAAITAEAVGYESVTRRIAPGNGDLAFESEVRPDLQRATEMPTQAAPGESISLEFDIEHAKFATLFAGESLHSLDPSAVSVSINGEPAEIGDPVNVADASTLRLGLDIEDGRRGMVPLSVSLAAGEPTTQIDLDPIHVHERPMQVTPDEDLQAAIDVAAPETTVALAGDRWELSVESFELPFPDARYGNPVFKQSRDDRAGLVVDKPLRIVAADDSDPKLVATGGSGDRTFGLQIANHFATLQGIEVVAEDAMAAVSVLDGDGVHLRNLDLSGAGNGVHAQFTKSLVVRGSTISASETSVTLRDLSVNALVEGNTVQDAGTGVFLSGRTGERLFEVDAEVTGNTFGSVGTEIDREGTATITGGDGETKVGGGESTGGSMLDLLLYAATATAIGGLFYPYARRQLGGQR